MHFILIVFVVFFIWSSMRNMRSNQSEIFVKFHESTSSIERNVKLKDKANLFSIYLRSSCMACAE